MQCQDGLVSCSRNRAQKTCPGSWLTGRPSGLPRSRVPQIAPTETLLWVCVFQACAGPKSAPIVINNKSNREAGTSNWNRGSCFRLPEFSSNWPLGRPAIRVHAKYRGAVLFQDCQLATFVLTIDEILPKSSHPKVGRTTSLAVEFSVSDPLSFGLNN
jgi:hypothetical protein